METETEQIFKEQLGKLPSVVVDFISSENWDDTLDEIGSLYNLSEEELGNFKREVTLVLAGLVHPDEFRASLEQEVGMQGAVLDAVVASVEDKIFAPIRPALITFFESESQNDADEVPPVLPAPNVPPVPRMPDIAPDNLPTGEEEPFLPPIPEKISSHEEPAHPFEEKMKRVFTAGQQSMDGLVLEPVAPQAPPAPTPDTAHTYHADQYREPIE